MGEARGKEPGVIFMSGMTLNYQKGEKMTQEQFEALGIEKNLAGKAAEASKKELEGYVSKDTYDQLEQQKNQLETSVNDYKTQMETLKTAAGDNEDLKNQIAQLQQQNQQKDQEHQKELKELKLTNAIKMAVAASAQDSELVAGLLDRNKLILGDDGKITGLDEQVKALKESKPFLFKTEQKPTVKRGFFPIGGKETGEDNGNEGGRMTMKEAIAAKLNMGTDGKE
nr:MAG TPA: minor structural protein [Caudoviricetes sp.]